MKFSVENIVNININFISGSPLPRVLSFLGQAPGSPQLD